MENRIVQIIIEGIFFGFSLDTRKQIVYSYCEGRENQKNERSKYKAK